MLAAKGILTSRGGLVSHAAVVARGWGKPAVVGAEAVVVSDRTASIAGHAIAEGEWLSIDGGTGEIMLGQVPVTAAEAPKELTTILAWADAIRKGHLAVRANADTGADAATRSTPRRRGDRAVPHGAHVPRRGPPPHRAAHDPRATPSRSHDALEELRVAQRADFLEILEAMDGLPVTVRLLDPPLHEFLPSTEELRVKEATEGLSDEERLLFDAARLWREVNPMLGTRGVRLGVVRPGLYEMQVRALLEAAVERLAPGGRPIIEVMIPLTVSRAELALARSWVELAVVETVPVADAPTR